MKMIGLTCTAIAAVMLADAASAALSDSEARQLMTKYNCQACHAVDKKLVGPGFKDVATKYAGEDRPPKDSHKKSRQGAAVYGAPSRCHRTTSLMPSATNWLPGFLG